MGGKRFDQNREATALVDWTKGQRLLRCDWLGVEIPHCIAFDPETSSTFDDIDEIREWADLGPEVGDVELTKRLKALPAAQCSEAWGDPAEFNNWLKKQTWTVDGVFAWAVYDPETSAYYSMAEISHWEDARDTNDYSGATGTSAAEIAQSWADEWAGEVAQGPFTNKPVSTCPSRRFEPPVSSVWRVRALDCTAS